MKNYSVVNFYGVYGNDNFSPELGRFLAINLPHGSGINYDWYLEYTDERNFVTAKNYYHAMDEYGGYCHFWPFEFSIPIKDNQIDWNGEFDIFVTNRNCEHCECDADYLYETIYYSLKDAQNG